MYTLQILHASDLEGGVDAIDDAPNFAVVVDALEAEAAAQSYGSVLISAGDNYILGPFFSAGGDFGLADTYEGFYNELFGLIDVAALSSAADTDGDGFFDNDEIQAAIDADASLDVADVYTTDVNGDGFADFFEEIDTAGGRIDISIMNAMGFDASAVGNHEFDGGTGAFEAAIQYDSEEGNDLSDGRYGNPNYLQEVDWPGAQFPYLTANLDFSQDGDVGALFTDMILQAAAFESDLLSARVNPAMPTETGPDASDDKIAPATIIQQADGELIGVVGATTQVLESITSTGAVEVEGPDQNDMMALAAILQPTIDTLALGLDGMAGTADDINKIVLTSHLQQFALEVELVGLLSGVDVILAGGSDTISADDQDTLRPGDDAQQPFPLFVTGAGDDPVAIVSTAGEYSYVGRLVITFDDNGVVLPDSVDPAESGAFATDEAGVLAVTGAASLQEAIDASESATDVQNLANAVTEIVIALDSDIAGETDVFLNGQREDVRTQETNLGNLTADANLDAAQEIDPTVEVSLKNGGGIRASIGEIVAEGDGGAEFVPPQANPVSGKEEGQVSELDIDNSLRFDNGLVAITLTPEQLLIVLEHAVAATEEGATPGQFAQVGGLRFSFDPDGTAQELDKDGNVVVEGNRVESVALLGEDGEETLIVDDGEILAAAPDAIRIVTLNFLLDGGDGYPYPNFIAADPDFADVVDLGIGEQEALSTFLTENFAPDGDEDFSGEDTPIEDDTRIQNLNEREDTIDDTAAPQPSGALLFEVVAELEGEGGEGASEVVAHEDGLLYVTNGELGRIDVFDIATEMLVKSIDLTGLDGFDGVQSVDVANGVVAAAIERAPEPIFFGNAQLSQPGFVAFFDADTSELLSRVDVGNLPDDVTFTPDGTTLVVAGEGEKNADSENDDNPLGTVTLIDVSDPAVPVAQILNFTQFNGLEEIARDAGIRLQEDVSFAEDVEPEYVAISSDGTTAYVSLQENNAIAQVDLATGQIVDILPLGQVDFGSESALDPLDNGEIDIRQFENLVGLRMPDAIATFHVGGTRYIATANEGDSRDFDEARVADLVEDGALDPDLVADLQAQGLIDDDPDTDIGLERLEVSTIDGDTDGDGDIDVLTAFSARSFSIFDDDGNLVFDSGADFERIIAEVAPERFNDDDGTGDENRSDAKGPEPEAIATGQIGTKIFAFIGLERDSGIMIYDITIPANAQFVDYIPPKFTDFTPDDEVARQAPEVITFIPAEESTTGNAQIAVAYEVSGTTIVYDLTLGDTGITPIPEIQGEGHISPFEGQIVTTTGIVTAFDFNGYYLQDPVGDGNPATSDAIFVFTGAGSESPVAVGDQVEITGEVQEFIPGGADTGNLSTTEIRTAEATVLSSGNPLPQATVLGQAGRVPPDDIVISDDELPVNLQESPGDFDPEEDGIDFYESLEAMRVTVDDPVTISATNRFDETWVVADDGAGTTPPLADRGVLLLNADEDGLGDLNPERIQLQYDNFFDLLPDGFDPPELDVGADLSDVTGVVGYSFGNFEVLVTDAFEVESPSPLTQEVTDIEGGEDRLTVATYNVLNVTSAPADDDAAQIAALARQIVDNLGSPDIVALQEIQDNSGEADDGTLSADETLQALVDAIAAAGGPSYQFESAVVDEDGEAGGVPGGNIRNAFLWNPDRVDADSFLTLESVQLAAIGVDNPDAFDGTRDPLLGVFTFDGEEITLINNHFSSRFGSDPIFGGPQPFFQAGEDEREAQAKAINQVVDSILAGDPNAKVAVLGDLNTFEFTDELTEDLPGVGAEKVLTNLIDQLPEDDAYTFNFQGNSQVLDHIFVTDNLLDGAMVDVVHTNVDFVDAASDHEPVVASFEITDEPTEGLVLLGDRQRNTLEGGAGPDVLIGLGAGDILVGEDGNDILLGGRGLDILLGGGGNDLLIGGLGSDTFQFGGDFGTDWIVDFDPTVDAVVFLDTETEEVAVTNRPNGVVLTVDNEASSGSVLLVGVRDLDPDQYLLMA